MLAIVLGARYRTWYSSGRYCALRFGWWQSGFCNLQWQCRHESLRLSDGSRQGLLLKLNVHASAHARINGRNWSCSVCILAISLQEES